MSEKTKSLGDFERDYEILNLKENAEWATARNHYQKLVHKWHPDKFSDRPSEQDDAQKQFIALSKSYTSLKEFYSLHQRLPFENNKPEESRPDATINANPNSESKKSNVDPNNMDLGTLSRDESRIDARLLKKSPLKKILWITVASAVVVGTVMLFFILDQKSNQRNLAIGRQVVKETPKSEFNPSESEIRRSQSKGAFILK